MHDRLASDPLQRVLVVCHGNINRSPVCAAVLRSLRPDWSVREAALKAWNNPSWRPERAAKKMREAALDRHGIDLETHRSRAIAQEDLDWAQVVLYMDGGNYSRLLAMRPEPGPGRQWVSLGSLIGQPRIPDPNFTPRGPTFNAILDQVVRASHEASKKLILAYF